MTQAQIQCLSWCQVSDISHKLYVPHIYAKLYVCPQRQKLSGPGIRHRPYQQLFETDIHVIVLQKHILQRIQMLRKADRPFNETRIQTCISLFRLKSRITVQFSIIA